MGEAESVSNSETGVISRPEREIPYWFLSHLHNRRSPPVLLSVPGFIIPACGRNCARNDDGCGNINDAHVDRT